MTQHNRNYLTAALWFVVPTLIILLVGLIFVGSKEILPLMLLVPAAFLGATFLIALKYLFHRIVSRGSDSGLAGQKMKTTMKRMIILLTAISLVITWAYGDFLHSVRYRTAVKFMEQSETVRKYLGRIQSYRLTQEDVVMANGKRGDISLKVKGEKEQGVISFLLGKHVGVWKVDDCILTIDDGKRISLTEKVSAVGEVE